MNNPLLGTWLLQSAEDCIDGIWEKPFGESPKGYFSFAADGHVSVQFMKSPLGAGEAANEHYLAYFGIYTVDERAGTFTSTVTGSISPALVGTKQTRKFRIEGNRLMVGDLVTFRRTFVKV
jgi:hypothetical protein